MARKLSPHERESAIQKAIVDYIRIAAPDCIVFAVPNAPRRSRAGRASNGVAGLTPGIPDLVVAPPHGRCLFLEVKGPKGKLSGAQEAIINRMFVNGIPVAVVRSIDDARAALMHHQIQLREVA